MFFTLEICLKLPMKFPIVKQAPIEGRALRRKIRRNRGPEGLPALARSNRFWSGIALLMFRILRLTSKISVSAHFSLSLKVPLKNRYFFFNFWSTRYKTGLRQALEIFFSQYRLRHQELLNFLFQIDDVFHLKDLFLVVCNWNVLTEL